MRTHSLPNIILRAAIIIGQLGLAIGLSTIALLRPQLPNVLSGLQTLVGTPDQALAAYNPTAPGAASAMLTLNNAPLAGYDLGNRVWFDTNDDGILNVGEQPISNVTMQLHDTTGGVIATTTTNPSGYYSFTNLLAGTYSVTVAANNFVAGGTLAGYWNSDPTTASSNVAGDNDRDHGLNPATYAAYLANGISSGSITLGAGLPTGEDGSAPVTPNGDSNNNLTLDFGFYKLELGNQVWFDTDNGSSFELTEVGVISVPVTLLDGNRAVVSTTMTDAGGLYTFTNLMSNTYQIVITAPVNYLTSQYNSEALDFDGYNDGIQQTGRLISSSIFSLQAVSGTVNNSVGTLADGTTRNTAVDFGLNNQEIGNTIWVDTNNDGLFNNGELPYTASTLTVTLLGKGGNVISTTTTTTGIYTFTQVPDGEYVVSVTLPGGYGPSTPVTNTTGIDDNNNGTQRGLATVSELFDARLGNAEGSIVVTNIDATTINPSIDFGIRRVAQFGDRVWIESDTDGIASTGVITPVIGMEITADDGNKRYSTFTDAQGYYVFSLDPGTYSVSYGAVPAVYGVLVSSATPGGNTTSGNAGSYKQGGNPDQSRPKDSTVTVGLGESNWTMDFAFYQPTATFGDFVWIESDSDGIASTGIITPVAGKVITATASNGVVYVQTTDASGYYTFVVPAGLVYTVNYGPAPVGTVPSAAPNSGTASNGNLGNDQESRPNNTRVSLNPDDVIPTIDFGFTVLPANPPVLGAITVTKQVVGDGIGPFDIGLAGPNGYVSNTSVVSGSTVVFTDLALGVYTLTEVSPSAGWLVTSTVSGSALTTSVTSGGTAVITLSNVITAPLTAPGPITGQVYNDYNSDGNISDNGVLTDTGVASVTVTAYDRNGNVVGSTTTDLSGTYGLTPTAAGPWRLEFTGLPSGYNPSRVSNGTQNGTTVQFVDSAPAGNVNLGIMRSLDYIGGTPRLVSVATSGGDPLLGGNAANQNAVFLFNTSTSGDATFLPPVLATALQVGSTYGVAWQPDSQRLFVSAVVRRHAGLGTGGLGGIYVIANPQTAPATSLFVDLEAAPFNINLGTLGDNVSRGLPADNLPNLDPTAFGAVGKQGLGDIDVTEDQQWLFAVDLNNRALIRLNVAGGSIPTSATSYALSNMPGAPSCTQGVLRPWGIKFYQGNGYVGAVCTGENGTTDTNLIAYVLRFDPNNPTSLTTILSIPLNYTKGFSNVDNPLSNTTLWHYWTEASTDADWPLYAGAGRTIPPDGSRDATLSRPMAMLSDIEFDASGDMVLGFRDRGGDMFGHDNFWPNSTSFFIDYRSGGDVLKACANGAGGWTLESNGSCGGANGIGVGGNQGPGGGEFYDDDHRIFSPNYPGFLHQEISVGGLAARRDAPEIAMSVYDAVNFSDGGVRWLSNANGTIVRNYSFVGYFGKANSVGDLEMMYAPAPIEIGNRVWFDVNGNGVQDPGEPAISGVQVELLNPATGAVLQTVTTDLNGTYYFTREATTGAYTNTLRPNTAYSISIATGQSMLSGYQLTVKDAQAVSGSTQSNDAVLDVRDSDATLLGSGAGSVAQIFYTTGGTGQSNHGLDFGFVPSTASGAVALTNTSPTSYDLGNRVWFDTNDDGTLNSGEQPISNVTMQLRDITGTVIATTTTNASGYYSFTNLPAGTYTAVVAASNFAAGGILDGYWNSSPTTASSNNTGDNNQDHGLNPATYAEYLANGVSSGSITLGAGLPVNEDAGAPTTFNGDSYNNLTIDFGFYTQQVGNTIWVDANDDGLLNNGELPYTAGLITVTLLDNSGAIVSTTTTATGLYTFTGVPSGTFVVSITVPAGFSSSAPTTNTAGLDNNDNGTASGAFIVSAPFTATPGTALGSIFSNTTNGTTVNPSIDFGLYAPATFGNFVWIESDTDGIASTGTITPVVGMVITATSSTGVIYTQTTNAQGYYTFTVPSGIYTVTYGTAPSGTVPSATPNPGTASGGSQGNDQQSRPDSTVVTLVPGDVIPTIDFGFHVPPPSISLRKYTNGFDADSMSGPYIAVGDTVTWTYVVTNTGGTVLTVAAGELHDDRVGPINAAPFVLAVGQVQTFTWTGIATLGQYTNTGIVTGTSPAGSSVTATNPSHYFGFTPNLVLIKFTNGFDADTLPLACNVAGGQACVLAGSIVTWTYRVTNTGTLTMSVAAGGLHDDRVGAINPNAFSLAPNASVVFTKTGIATLGQYTNTGIVTGTPVLPPGAPITPDLPGFPSVLPPTSPVTRTNPSHYLGVGLNLGNQVWLDINNNGLIDGGEQGLTGVRVELYRDTDGNGVFTPGVDTFDRFSNTVAGGYYTFTALPEGNYVVVITTTNFIVGGPLAGYRSSDVTEVNPNNNIDNNDNGVVTGLPGAGGWVSSNAISLTVGSEPSTVVVPGDSNWTVDFGFWQPAALGDFVWSDLDADGQQDAGEPGVNGVTVTLYQNGVPISTTSTFNYLGTDGYYTFTNLLSGTYSVTFGLPAGFVGFTTPNSGNDVTDSDAVPVTPILAATGNYVLFPGDQQITVDAGLIQPAGLGDRVWEDFNHNGVQDAGEPGVANVTVTLQTPTGTLTTLTNPNGLYTFTNLVPGVLYTVSFTAPDGYTFTLPTVGTPATDSNVTTPQGGTPGVTLGLGEFNPTIDAGLWRPLSLGNRVWEDLNNDGLLGAGEPGVANVPVALLNSSGAVLSTTTTNAAGFYTFTNLISGTYVVSITAPPGYRSSSDIGSSGTPDNNTDSDDNGLGTGGGAIVSHLITLIPGTEPTTDDVSEGLPGNTSTNWTVDFGIWRPATLGDYVWSDLDTDGQQDVGEPGVSGVTVTLYHNGVPISTTTTDAAGAYLFTNLLSGTYSVTFGLPAGFVGFTTPNSGVDATDSDAVLVTPVLAATGNYVLFPGDVQLTVDAGLIQPAGLGDLVWFDIDHDGVQDAGEPGIPNMTVTLQTLTGTLVTTTDANGYYSFTNLLPGVLYTVGFTAPNGYTFTLPMVGTPATDSNVNPSTGTVPPVSLAPGQFDPTIDAGLWMPPPTLVLQKTAAVAGGAVRSGDLVTYTMVVSNDGPGIATRVVISDPLPVGLEYIPGSAVPAAQVNGQLLVWTKPTLGVGERFTMTFVTRVRPSSQLTGTQILNLGFAFAVAPENQLVRLPAETLEDDAQVSVPFVPTAVVLTLFEANWLNQENGGSAVHVAWETGSEINTFGFSLYRSADGTRASAVLVTPELIRSTSVNNGGAGYRFDDMTAQAGTTYTYWLQELETTGIVNEYGPADTSGRQVGLHTTQRLFLPVLMH